MEKDKIYRSNNWKKMHHIPIKSKTINGYKIIRFKLDYYSSRSRKKQKKYHMRHYFNPNQRAVILDDCDFGKTVFFSRPEAEAKRKEMEGKSDVL